ncbi:MAG: hypothetical protein Q9M19_03765 [Mariprofundaceae bacterium]|nr:hypothetical protein [Mariprofundaceae bacterium]
MTLALTLFLCWLSLWLLNKIKPQASRNSKLYCLLLLAPLYIYPFVYSPVWALRGLTGDLSILSMFLLISALHQQLQGKFLINKQERRFLPWFVTLLGITFYPLALGLGNIDPYAWGYADLYMVITLLLLATYALWRHYYFTGLMLLGVLLAWDMQLLQSVNLWDYLLDPFIVFFYLGRVIKGCFHAR